MYKIPLPRQFFLLLATLSLLALACGLIAPADTPTPTPAATSVALGPTAVPTDIPATTPTETAVASDPTPLANNDSDERHVVEAVVSMAVGRATTMMAQNAKPTPPSSGLGGKETEGGTAAATPTTPPQPTAVPQRGAAGLYLDNLSSATACFVYISLPTDSSWGADRLEATEVISSGNSRLFELSSGSYDLRVDDCSGKIIYAEFEIPVNDLVSIPLQDRPTPAAGNAPLTILNDLDSDVCYLFVSPSTSDSWGSDWLGTGQTLPVDGRLVLNVPENSHDLLAADCALEPVAELYGININRQGYVWSLSGAAASRLATFELVNNGPTSVCYVQISLATADTWGPDWLGEEEIIRAGANRLFEVPPDIYDVRVLDCQENTLKEEYGVNIQGTVRWSAP